jgi:dihydrolipoamide dehydrogenase
LQAASERGLQAPAYDVPSSSTAGASFHGRNIPGTSRIVVDEERAVIVGATFVGPDVAEWLHAATVAIVSSTPIDLLWQAVPAFPTRSEVWLKLLERREADLERRLVSSHPRAAQHRQARPGPSAVLGGVGS